MTFNSWDKAVLKALTSLLSENISINLHDDRENMYSIMHLVVDSFFPVFSNIQNHEVITIEASLKRKCFPIFFFLYLFSKKILKKGGGGEPSSSPTFAKCGVSLIFYFELERAVTHMSVS